MTPTPQPPPSGSEASAMLAELKHTISLGPDAAANAAQRLLGAVEAVLERHERFEYPSRAICRKCRQPWPCEDVEAISAELKRPRGGDDPHH